MSKSWGTRASTPPSVPNAWWPPATKWGSLEVYNSITITDYGLWYLWLVTLVYEPTYNSGAPHYSNPIKSLLAIISTKWNHPLRRFGGPNYTMLVLFSSMSFFFPIMISGDRWWHVVFSWGVMVGTTKQQGMFDVIDCSQTATQLNEPWSRHFSGSTSQLGEYAS